MGAAKLIGSIPTQK